MQTAAGSQLEELFQRAWQLWQDNEVGAGLRLVIPAMGPAPIALDFAYPLLKESFDEKQIFSFYIGFTR